jgi:hypothetical protein
MYFMSNHSKFMFSGHQIVVIGIFDYVEWGVGGGSKSAFKAFGSSLSAAGKKNSGTKNKCVPYIC